MTLRLPSFLSVFLAAGMASSGQAQESCDVESKTAAMGSTQRFVQILRCGDADVTNAYDCMPGTRDLRIVLPLAPFDAAEGQKFEARLSYGGQPHPRSFVVVAPVPDGAGDPGALIEVAADDPLWRALATPGLDIPADNGDFSTVVGTVIASARDLARFKEACGL